MPESVRQRLAKALERVHAAAVRGIVRSADMNRADRELLQRHGYLVDIVKGWYFLAKPTTAVGESTAWYANYWTFLSVYLENRFGEDYCLSAASSLDVHLGVSMIPHQVVAMSGHGGKTLLDLPHDTSLLAYEERGGISWDVDVVTGLRVMPLALVLCRLPETFFHQRRADAEIALRSLISITELVRLLLSGGSVAAAQRLSGAFRYMGDLEAADEIMDAMKSAGYVCRPVNPFMDHAPLLRQASGRGLSPYAARISALFRSMQEPVEREIASIQQNTELPETYLHHMDDVYVHDAYHSLSIEGYEVTPELIQRIRAGEWDPEHNPGDVRERNAMAARGYLEAFLAVKETLSDILAGQPPVEAIRRDYGVWYRALFSASVQAGILEAHHLAGFRNGPVYIWGSRHVPLPPTAVADAINTFFTHLAELSNPSVRAVLGHFVFTFIHPYMDGNGRMARFLMNAMMASGGHPWTIIRVERRKDYMAALEAASCEGNITPFTRFILEESAVDWGSTA
ncbi:MAG: Fic family protein [Lentisphaerae bacterium]|nr:Fic family protein [Lentisphaerota bacterium]